MDELRAECTWDYIDRLRMALAAACKERDELKKELIDERDRFDRLSDFEVAENQELAAAKAEIERLHKENFWLTSGGEFDGEAAMEFLNGYAFPDSEKFYTNGSMLVPLFRVKQAVIDKAYNGMADGG